MRRLGLLLPCALSSACGLLSGLDGLAVNDASFDVGVADVADASDTAVQDASTPPIVIVTTATVVAPTGNAQQAHIVWAEVAKQWWLFYIDNDALKLKTMWSPDFVQWKAGPPLVVTANGGDGRNFTVAYGQLNQTDVVHIGLSIVTSTSTREHLHTRGIIGPGTIAFDATTTVSSTPVLAASSPDPDGCAVAVGGGGAIGDATGFATPAGPPGVAYGSSAFVGTTADTGSSPWTAAFTQHDFTPPAYPVHTRGAYLSAGALIVAWESADTTADPTNVIGATRLGAVWGAGNPLFSPAPQDANDWGASLGSDFHLARARLDGTYDELHGTTTMTLAPAPRAGRTGLPLVTDGKRAFVIDQDASHTLRVLPWNGSAWATSWTTVDAVPVQRTFLSAASVPAASLSASGGFAVIWTQSNGTGKTEIVGERFNF